MKLHHLLTTGVLMLSFAVGNAMNAGITVVVAAGNTGSKITNPATANRPVVVGSTDSLGTTNPADDVVSDFSAADGRMISVDVVARVDVAAQVVNVATATSESSGPAPPSVESAAGVLGQPPDAGLPATGEDVRRMSFGK